MTASRQRVRTIASSMSCAWCTSVAMAKPVCASARPRSPKKTEKCSRHVVFGATEKTPSSAGSTDGAASAISTNADQMRQAAGGSAQPAISASTVTGADSVRRRLSSIFQRPSSVAAAGLPLLAGGWNSQPRSCQSPRAQRCWREVATS